LSKIVSTLRISAIFLATVLVAGTIALSYPSFMIGAQAQQYYGMNNYEDRKSYGMDSYDLQYPPSYKPDYYKPKYQSYGEDYYKSQKDSTTINKINCINSNNINVNGDFNGNITTFAASSGLAAKGDLSAGSFGGNSGERYYDGYDNNKKDKGFECIINNNNTNTNIITVGGGNVTDGNVTLTCEECFTAILSAEELADLEAQFAAGGVPIFFGASPTFIDSFTDFCTRTFVVGANIDGLTNFINQFLAPIDPNPSPQTIAEIIACVAEALGIEE
jgi:hypothetical protein